MLHTLDVESDDQTCRTGSLHVVSQQESDTPVMRWGASDLFPHDLPSALALDRSLADEPRNRLQYFCDLLHEALAKLEFDGPMPIAALCTALRISEPEFRSIWATFYLDGYEGLRQEALHPTFSYSYDGMS